MREMVQDLKDRNVTLVADPYWPDRYEHEQHRIQDVASNGLLGVFHVGSTAIPDVPGKPALDIIAVYDDEDAMMTGIERLTDDDRYEREAGSTVSIRWADACAVFIKAHTSGDEKVASQLLFRDYLRENQEARARYARVKQEAAKTHPADLEAYTTAKSEVVRSILEQARDEGYDESLPEIV